MSKNLSLATVTEKNRLSSDVAFLVFLDITVIDPATGLDVETLHVVRNSEDITLVGTLYAGSNFDLQLKEESGSQPEVSLSIKDHSRALQGRMQAYGGGVGFLVKIMVVSAAELTSPPQLVEFFEVIGATAVGYVVSFTLGTENHLARTVPARRQFRDFCAWRYKDPTTCKYAGAMPTCDLTLQGANGCQAHANSVNFGAFPGLRNLNVRYS